MVPEDAACFYQVAAGGALHPEVLCGPYRVAPHPDTSWDVVPITGGYGDGGKVIPQQAGDGAEGAPTPGTELVRPDGRTANLDATVDLPALEEGAVYPMSAEPAGRDVDVQGPEDMVTVTVTDPATTLADADGEWVAADGVSLIGLRLVSTDRKTDPVPVTILIEAGGATHEIATLADQADLEEAPLNVMVAVPGDGTDAVLLVDFDGQRQQRVPLNGDPVVPVVFRTFFDEVPLEHGSVDASLHSKIAWDYAEYSGWAAPGRAWLQIDLVDSRRGNVTWEKLDVDIDGKRVSPVSESIDSYLFDVPDTASRADVHITASHSGFGFNPTSFRDTVTFTLQPAR